MSSTKKEVQSIIDKYLNADMYLSHYTKLNALNNINEFPWDMRKKIDDEYFVPTYNNVALYYSDITFDKKPAKNKTSKRSAQGGSNKTTVYFI